MLFWSKKHCSVKIPGCRSILALLVMGATCSKANDETVANNFKILASQTPFTETEVESLYELYRKLSSSITKNGYIDKEEFQLAVFRDSKQKNLFLDRMFVLFDVDGNGHIEFGEFVCSLGVFHPKAPQEAKIKYLFELYDLRRTGFIEHEEVKEMVLALLQESDLVLDGDAVGMIVDKTFTEADTKCDGRIDEEEWKEYVDKNPSMLKNMTLPHLIDINQAFPSFVLNTEAKDL